VAAVSNRHLPGKIGMAVENRRHNSPQLAD
jgi:hypothetical protein